MNSMRPKAVAIGGDTNTCSVTENMPPQLVMRCSLIGALYRLIYMEMEPVVAQSSPLRTQAVLDDEEKRD